MHEYNSLERLYRLGAAVPQPIASSENAVLMGYVGDEKLAAPALNEIRLDTNEAESLFQDALHNIELMLSHEIIHGDLSAYNILYWNGKIILIDFPQVVNYQSNNSAHFILQRDIKRVCEYFSKQGVNTDPDQILADLWERYAAKDPLEQANHGLANRWPGVD
jgi:RIO kinase 1